MQFISETKCALCHANGPEVNCILCQAPHHMECWDYNNNRCSIYGCYSLHNSSQLNEFKEIYNSAMQIKENPSSISFVSCFKILLVLIFSLITVLAVFGAECFKKPKEQFVPVVEEDSSVSNINIEQMISHAPLGICVSSKFRRVFFFNGDRLICLALGSSYFQNQIALMSVPSLKTLNSLNAHCLL